VACLCFGETHNRLKLACRAQGDRRDAADLVIELAEDAAQLGIQERAAGGREIACENQQEHETILTWLANLVLEDFGELFEQVDKEEARDDLSTGEADLVHGTAGDWIEQGQAATAGAGAACQPPEVTDGVADEEGAQIVQVGDEDVAVAIGAWGSDLDHEIFDVEVQTFVAVALGADRHEFARAVGFEDGDAEDLAEEAADRRGQRFGGREHGAQEGQSKLPALEVTGEMDEAGDVADQVARAEAESFAEGLFPKRGILAPARNDEAAVECRIRAFPETVKEGLGSERGGPKVEGALAGAAPGPAISPVGRGQTPVITFPSAIETYGRTAGTTGGVRETPHGEIPREQFFAMLVYLLAGEHGEALKIVPSADILQPRACGGVFALIERDRAEGDGQQAGQFLPLEIAQLFCRPPLARFKKPADAMIAAAASEALSGQEDAFQEATVKAHQVINCRPRFAALTKRGGGLSGSRTECAGKEPSSRRPFARA